MYIKFKLEIRVKGSNKKNEGSKLGGKNLFKKCF